MSEEKTGEKMSENCNNCYHKLRGACNEDVPERLEKEYDLIVDGDCPLYIAGAFVDKSVWEELKNPSLKKVKE